MFNAISGSLKYVGEVFSNVLGSPTDSLGSSTHSESHSLDPVDVFLPRPFRSVISASVTSSPIVRLFQNLGNLEKTGQEAVDLLEKLTKARKEYKYDEERKVSGAIKKLSENSPYDLKKLVYNFYVAKAEEGVFISNTDYVSPFLIAPPEEWTPFFKEIKDDDGNNSKITALDNMMFRVAIELSERPETRSSEAAKEFKDFCFDMYSELSWEGSIFDDIFYKELTENTMQYAAFLGDPRALDKAIEIFTEYRVSSEAEEGSLDGIQPAAFAIGSFKSSDSDLIHKRDTTLLMIQNSPNTPPSLKDKLRGD